MRHTLAALCLASLSACGHPSGPATPTKPPMRDPKMMDDMMAHNPAMPADPASAFGPLEVGADLASYTKVSKAPFRSPTHGGREVEVWVNQVGVAAYEDERAELPVGTVIVKTSTDHGAPGPMFIMARQEGAAGGWYYAIRWEAPSEKWKAALGGPIYWRTPSKKADYCVECHESYDRNLGGVPEGNRTWQ
jgi:hypothetical protein